MLGNLHIQPALNCTVGLARIHLFSYSYGVRSLNTRCADVLIPSEYSHMVSSFTYNRRLDTANIFASEPASPLTAHAIHATAGCCR
jgi:hypothetical protein